ncbi:MAG: anthranilate phosphoribosyltransferase [Halanaerobiaceae bacterium]|nr:anthranilate phosphoribosyltransferase [Halanaerobiaceae bacterium]
MFSKYLEKVVDGNDLSELEMKETMLAIMSGMASESQIAGFLVALRMKGESIAEITGAAKALREKAVSIRNIDDLTIDTCGTGGDGSNTFNISSTVAFVLAGAGLSVAKHGNRSVSSSSGSADLLEALGVNLNITAEQAEKCLLDTNIAFLYAPVHHRAMKYALKPRRELGIRTIFNLLGPLINPAHVKYQIMGVYEPSLVYPVACVLKNLGLKRAMVVNGDGLDEFSLTGENRVAYLHDGIIEEIFIYPEDTGLSRIKLEEISGGSPDYNKKIVLDVLKGKKGPCREGVLFNSAAGFIVTGLVTDWKRGIELAEEVIDSGKAYEKLLELIHYTNSREAIV